VADEAFEKQLKWAELQLKATEVYGKYLKDQADARKTDAEALAQEEKDQALASLRSQLDKDLQLLNRHRRSYEIIAEILKKDQSKLTPLKTGYKPADLPTLYAIHEALSRILAVIDSSVLVAFYSTAVEAKAKTADNFVLVSKSAVEKDAPLHIDNLGSLLDWTKINGLFFRKASPAHLAVLKGIGEIDLALDKKVNALQAAIETAKTGDEQSIKALSELMGLAKDS
jgi:hypothetical protein